MSWSEIKQSVERLNELIEIGAGSADASSKETQTATRLCELINDRTLFSEVDNERVLFEKLLDNVLRHRVLSSVWRTTTTAGSDDNWVMVMCHLVRVLVRDASLRQLMYIENVLDEFLEIQIGVLQFASWLFVKYSEMSSPSLEITTSVRALLSVLLKLCNTTEQTTLIAELQCQKVVTVLLSSNDMSVLQASFQLLVTLCEHSAEARTDVCQSSALDQAITLLADSDLLTQKFCASLLRVLCAETEAREQLKVYDGLPVLISLLCTRNVRLQWHLAWTLSQLAEDADTANELGQRGIVQLILTELSDTKPLLESQQHSQIEDRMAMLTGLNAVLAQLCRVDSNAILIVQNNGVFTLARLLLLQVDRADLLLPPLSRNYELLQCSALRVLRLLFSLERNRLIFKRLFPPDFFSAFIDVGHYILELPAYLQLVASFREQLVSNEYDVVKCVECSNQQRKPLGTIQQYEILDQLGAGAFGCVYRVKKKDRNQHYALKEIFMHHGTLERESRGQDKSFGEIINEVKMIKEHLRHPNVVRYRRVFLENEKLYILMDLIDGASLKEHINSAKEKGLKFAEDRIWHIVVQIVLGLRYLHKDKKIIHRDLKPNNIMLAEGERVVITDFGLAKYRGEGYLKSNAGTILYSCPEMLQDEPYGDKADVWSFGCTVYEMCQLRPPFYSTNMLQLATIIVESKYESVSNEIYSEELTRVIDRCLTPDAAARPDIIAVSSLMASRLLTCLDEVFCAQYELLNAQANAASRQQRQPHAADTVSALAKRANTLTSSEADQSLDGSLNLTMTTVSSTSTTQLAIGQSHPTPPKLMGKRAKVPPKHVKSAHAIIIANHKDENGDTQNHVPRPTTTCKRPKTTRRTISATALPQIAAGSGSTKPPGLRPAWQSGDARTRAPVVLPSIHRSKSSTLVEQDLRMQSASSLVCVPASLLHPIDDPINRLLSVLHHVIYISQLPVEHSAVDHRRRVIEQFKRRLFTKDSSASLIKAELRKLMVESREPVALNLGYSDYRIVLDAVDPVAVAKRTSWLSRVMDMDYPKQQPVPYITYEQLYACIVAVLAARDPQDMPLERPESRLMTPGNNLQRI